MNRLRLVTFAVVVALSACGEPPKTEANAPEEEAKEPSTREVRISKEAIAGNGIRVDAVTVEALGGGVEVPAEVEPHPNRIARVSVLVAGRIDRADVIVGQKVKKGQGLATIDSAEIGNAQAEVTQAQVNLDAARATQKRQEELTAAGIGAKRDAQQADADVLRADAALAAAQGRVRAWGGGASGGTSLKSPLDGEVLERHATVGEVVNPGDAVFVVGDLSTVWVRGRLSEQHVGAARVGAAAELSLPAYPGKVFAGTLSYASPILDEKTRTLTVRMEIDNKDGLLRPGLFGKLRIIGETTGATQARPVVPESAVQRTPAGDVVFVATAEPELFHVVPVAVGQRRSGRVELLSGIDDGARVVVDGAFILKSELLKSQMAGED